MWKRRNIETQLTDFPLGAFDAACDGLKLLVTAFKKWAALINLINAFFLTLASAALNKLSLSDVLKIAAVLIMNSVCGAIAQYLFTLVRHQLRIKLCRRLSIEPSESNIAVMESIEYQTV